MERMGLIQKFLMIYEQIMDNYRSILRTDNGLLVSLTQRHNVAVEILLKTFNISIL